MIAMWLVWKKEIWICAQPKNKIITSFFGNFGAVFLYFETLNLHAILMIYHKAAAKRKQSQIQKPVDCRDYTNKETNTDFSTQTKKLTQMVLIHHTGWTTNKQHTHTGSKLLSDDDFWSSKKMTTLSVPSIIHFHHFCLANKSEIDDSPFLCISNAFFKDQRCRTRTNKALNLGVCVLITEVYFLIHEIRQQIFSVNT